MKLLYDDTYESNYGEGLIQVSASYTMLADAIAHAVVTFNEDVLSDEELIVRVRINGLERYGPNPNTDNYLYAMNPLGRGAVWHQPIGPLEAGDVVQILTRRSATVIGTGSIKIWAIDTISALNVPTPDASDRVAGSPLDDLRRCRAFLANKTIQTLSTGQIEVRDNDGVTTLFTLTPSESSGELTITPTDPS